MSAINRARLLVEEGRLQIERRVNSGTNPHADYYAYRWLVDGAAPDQSLAHAFAALAERMLLDYELPSMGSGRVPVTLRDSREQ